MAHNPGIWVKLLMVWETAVLLAGGVWLGHSSQKKTAMERGTYPVEVSDMKLHFQKLVIVLSTAAILLVLTVFYLSSRNGRSTELLIAWGRQGEPPERKCILQVINPENQELGPVHTLEEHCNYQIVNLQGEPRLVGGQTEPRAIVIYTITATGDLVMEKTIPVEVWPGLLQLAVTDGGAIYFPGSLSSTTGIMQGRVQLLQLDYQTEEISSFIAYEEGMIDFPQLSPDGSFLNYSIYPGSETWSYFQYSRGSYYRLLNLETKVDIDLASRVNHLAANPLFTHCNLRWSPSGRFIAFNVGCESASPQYIIIFNVETNEAVDVIKPVEETFTSNAGLVGWLSNDAIVYGQSVSKEGYESQRFYRY
ncbi:MAG: hypothetical protein R6X34_26055, partial [Chloroflexota bacterium]